jgi:hypothetical protein
MFTHEERMEPSAGAHWKYAEGTISNGESVCVSEDRNVNKRECGA